MAQHKLQQADAFDLLRRTSQDQNCKLYEIALTVVSTGEIPSLTRTAQLTHRGLVSGTTGTGAASSPGAVA
jgi:hypothetical protein